MSYCKDWTLRVVDDSNLWPQAPEGWRDALASQGAYEDAPSGTLLGAFVDADALARTITAELNAASDSYLSLIHI